MPDERQNEMAGSSNTQQQLQQHQQSLNTNNPSIDMTLPTLLLPSNTPTPLNSTDPNPMDILKSLRHFLHTLLNLTRNSVPDKLPLIQTLIQHLLNDKIDPETFIEKLEMEGGPPPPSIVSFLKKAIAHWKLVNRNESIESFIETNADTNIATTAEQQDMHTPIGQQQQLQTGGQVNTVINSMVNSNFTFCLFCLF
jgi:hypothetical protein